MSDDDDHGLELWCRYRRNADATDEQLLAAAKEFVSRHGGDVVSHFTDLWRSRDEAQLSRITGPVVQRLSSAITPDTTDEAAALIAVGVEVGSGIDPTEVKRILDEERDLLRDRVTYRASDLAQFLVDTKLTELSTEKTTRTLGAWGRGESLEDFANRKGIDIAEVHKVTSAAHSALLRWHRRPYWAKAIDDLDEARISRPRYAWDPSPAPWAVPDHAAGTDSAL